MTLRVLALLGSLAINAVPLVAQTGAYTGMDTAASAANAPVEVFGGFSAAAGGVLGTAYGFNGGVDFRLIPRLFLVAEINQFRDPPEPSDTMAETLYLAGPRYLVPLSHTSRASVFGQFLIGGDRFHNGGQPYTYRFNNASGYAMAGDGGLDYALRRHLGARFQGGYLFNRFKNSTYGGPVNPAYASEHRVRFGADVVYRF